MSRTPVAVPKGDARDAEEVNFPQQYFKSFGSVRWTLWASPQDFIEGTISGHPAVEVQIKIYIII